MRLLPPSLLLVLAACSSESPPERVALDRAAGMIQAAGKGDGSVLAPIFGLDGEGQPGLCGAIETPAGVVRVVVDLAAGTVRAGAPDGPMRIRPDLGESRWCTAQAQGRWARSSANDPVGLRARLGDY
jgi:hypothetical protein